MYWEVRGVQDEGSTQTSQVDGNVGGADAGAVDDSQTPLVIEKL